MWVKNNNGPWCSRPRNSQHLHVTQLSALALAFSQVSVGQFLSIFSFVNKVILVRDPTALISSSLFSCIFSSSAKTSVKENEINGRGKRTSKFEAIYHQTQWINIRRRMLHHRIAMAIGLLRFRSSIIVWTITSEPSKPSLSSVEKMMKIIMFFNELKFSVCLPQFSSATVPKVN